MRQFVPRAAGIASWTAVTILIASIFFMSATFGRLHFSRYSPSDPPYYGRLLDGFKQGHLYLLQEPDPRLLQVSDPYSPLARGDAPFIWDASFYNGKFYLYFGAVPALAFYLPYDLLFGYYPDDHLAILVFSLGCVLLLTLGLHLLLDYRGVHAIWPLQIWCLVAAFCGSLSLLLGGGIYVVAEIAGWFFILGYLCTIIKSLSRPRSLLWPLLGGVALVLAVGCRPTLIFYAACAPFCYLFSAAKPLAWRQYSCRTFAYLLPVTVGMGMLFLYNFMRFDNPFEFGIKYQLTIGDFSKESVCSIGCDGWLKRGIYQSWHLLFSPPNVAPSFPYLSFDRYVPDLFKDNKLLDAPDAVVGVLASSPVISLGLIALLFSFRALSYQLRVFAAALLLTSAASLIFLLTCRYVTGRYTLDFQIPWLICACIGLWGLFRRNSIGIERVAIRSISAVFILASISIGFLGAFSGYYHKGITPEVLRTALKSFW